MDLSTLDIVANFDYITNFLLILPDQQSDCYKNDLSGLK